MRLPNESRTSCGRQAGAASAAAERGPLAADVTPKNVDCIRELGDVSLVLAAAKPALRMVCDPELLVAYRHPSIVAFDLHAVDLDSAAVC